MKSKLDDFNIYFEYDISDKDVRKKYKKKKKK